MSAIAPNGEVLLLRGVHLDKSYNHTYRFKSLENGGYEQQTNYFKSFVKPNMRGIKGELITFNLTNQLYQRVGQNVIRVGIGCDYLYDINYMMFKNNLFQVGKWFYAFVDEVRYINPNCSEVVYTIDVMQTWKFDYELGACFVEREHSVTDEVGDNIVPENFEISNYWVSGRVAKRFTNIESTHTSLNGTTYSGESYYTVIVNFLPNYSVLQGELYVPNYTNNIVTALSQKHFNLIIGSEESILTDLAIFIDREITNGTKIVSLMQVPTYMIINKNDEIEVPTINNIFYDTHSQYECINNKLKISPYSMIMCTDNSGTIKYYSPEKFDNVIKFILHYYYETGVCEMVCEPFLYNTGVSNVYNECMNTSNFYFPSWSEDSFTYWLAQNENKEFVNTISAVLKGAIGVAGILSGGVGAIAGLGIGLSGFQDISNLLINRDIAENHTQDKFSNASNNSALFKTAKKIMGFDFYTMKITASQAKIIDDYFNMFGYAINEVKVPQTTSRPYWNYVKTNGCIIHSVSGRGLPADAEQLISSIYDNGITFWNSDIDIGDYSYARQNRPI